MDPLTLATAAGAALNFAGDVAGGIFGSRSSTNESRNNRREARRQFNIQDEYNKNRIQYTVKDAIKAGVNPAAVVNSSGGHYSPTISAGGPSGAGDIIANSISSATRSLSDFIAKRQAKQDRAIALESANLDLESKRLQNDILRQKLLTETQPGIPVNSMPKNSNWRIPMDYNLRDVVPGKLFLPWEDLQGNVYWFTNPDAIADADYSNLEADRALAIGAKGVYGSMRKGFFRNRKKKTVEAVNALW